MAEITKNKRGYPKNGNTRSLEEINESLTRRGHATISQSDLEAMNGPRSPKRKEKATFFVIKTGEGLAIRVDRQEGEELIRQGKAKPVKRRDLKDGKVPTKDAVYAAKTSNNEKKKAKRKGKK